MYYVVYGILYVFSLLPLRVLFLFSDFAFFVLYRVMKYRRNIVMGNLLIAFPEKTEEEREKIAKKFYLNFTDGFIETIKMISISKKQLLRRTQVDRVELDKMLAKGRNVHLILGHQFNWEFANLAYATFVEAQFVIVYAPIGNKIFDRIFYKTRTRFGSILVSAREFPRRMHTIMNNQYVLVLAADQNPGNTMNAYWMKFFGKLAPFVKGPGKGAVKKNIAAIFTRFEKPKRGYYKLEMTTMVDNGADHTPEELMLIYKMRLEDAIRKEPANYLWSHRRWRHEWTPEHGKIIE